MEIITQFNIESFKTMNRATAYRTTLKLNEELGGNERELKSLWSTSNTKFWRENAEEFFRAILKRNKKAEKAKKLSSVSGEPLNLSLNLKGTTYNEWKREVRRIQMVIRRDPEIMKPNMTQFFEQRGVEELEKPGMRIRERTKEFEFELQLEVEARNKRLLTKKIENIIKEGNIQEIFNIVLNGTLLDYEQANHTITLINNSNLKYQVIFEFLDEKKAQNYRTVFLNAHNEDRLTAFLTSGFYKTYLDKGYEDAELLNALKVISAKVEKLKKPEKVSSTKDGRFFPYINESEFDLSRYQIYNQDQAYDKERDKEHCLIHSLNLAGISMIKLNKVKLAFQEGFNIKKKDLKEIANIIETNITIHEKRGNISDKATYGNYKKEVKIAICENHYFIMENTEYSSLYVNKYEELKDLRDAKDIIRIFIKGDKKYYDRDSSKSKMSSLSLVHYLLEKNKFNKLDFTKFDEASSHKELKEHIYLDNINEEQQEYDNQGLIEYVKNKEGVLERKKTQNYEIPSRILYADCESFVTGTVHELFEIGVVDSNNDNVQILTIPAEKFDNNKHSNAQEAVLHFLDILTNRGKENAICYFHNLKYDYSLLSKYLNTIKIIEKDGMMYNIQVIHKDCTVSFKDSFKLISTALKKFPEMFNLPEKYKKGEAIAYEYYTKDNYNKKISIEDPEYLKHLDNDKKKIFNKVVKESIFYDDKTKTFCPHQFYKEYLTLDCLILKKGLEAFKEHIENATGKASILKLEQIISENKIPKDLTKIIDKPLLNRTSIVSKISIKKLSIYDVISYLKSTVMNIHQCLTISSLSDKYMIKCGSYNKVFGSSDNLRAYIAKSVYGGRVHVNPKYKKQLITGTIDDFDGVSLYPSAIRRLCKEIGLPIGKAERLKELNNWDKYTYSIVTVKINKINKKQQIPFILVTSEDETRDLSNEPPEEPIVIDSITLKDYIKFHEIEYEILDGVYWNKGGNKIMGDVIEELFQVRLANKKNVGLSTSIKLMLNSAYGKTITKKVKTRSSIVKGKLEEYIYNNFNTIKECNLINENLGIYQITSICSDQSVTRGHVGCAILSTSKSIMNEVFDVANSNDLPIYYTDTDSIHLNRSDVPILSEKFKEKYNRELIGNQLGQFHSDFTLAGAKGDVYATHSIFLGKKSYYDRLESIDDKGNTISGDHYRLKGITIEGMENTAKEYDNGMMGFYLDLAKGTKKSIVLNPYDEETCKNKVLFEFKNGVVRTRAEFVREISF